MPSNILIAAELSRLPFLSKTVRRKGQGKRSALKSKIQERGSGRKTKTRSLNRAAVWVCMVPERALVAKVGMWFWRIVA